ncbi:MAG: DAK2 domain-containing protein, partial [Coriobacteriales bacterium]|nr:DAK2 domain-containing protein [Coriobacteriales bacterium]
MNVSILRLCISSASQALSDRQDDVNKLNVFPVPDGDTGTNMSLTMESVVEEVKALPATATPEQLSDAVIHGSLMGARGNSGVILSQILRGFCEGIDKSTIEFDSKNIAAALKNSVKLGCAAVHKPVKGTILTVIEDVSKVANKCSREKLDIAQTLNAIANE